jgi:hypothetical protein
MTTDKPFMWGLEFVRDFISLTQAWDSIGILTFSNGVEDSLPLSPNRQALTAEIQKLAVTDWRHVKGLRKTALRDALVSALGTLKNPHVGDAICVVSDGGENASRSSTAGLESVLASAGVRLYAFIPVWRFSGSYAAGEREGAMKLGRWVTLTGGGETVWEPSQSRPISLMPNPPPYGPSSVFSESDKAGLMRAAQGIYREISSFYKVSIRLPERLSQPSDWTLEVSDPSGRPVKHLVILYPTRLGPCNDAP